MSLLNDTTIKYTHVRIKLLKETLLRLFKYYPEYIDNREYLEFFMNTLLHEYILSLDNTIYGIKNKDMYN